MGGRKEADHGRWSKSWIRPRQHNCSGFGSAERTAGVKFGRKPKFTRLEEESFSTWIREETLSKEDLAEKFSVFVSTVYRRMSVIKKAAA